MSNSMFNGFKSTLKMALQDEDFRRKNSLFQDEAYLQNMLDRVDALTADVAISMGFENIISVLGMIVQDTAQNSIKFDTRGFATTLSAFREGLLNNPQKFWLRDVDGSDERYLLADRTGGILVLNTDVEVLHRFHNFGADLAGNDEYEDASDCCTFTVADTEYIAITMYSHHICNIYEYNTGVFVSRIGTIGTPGDTSGFLNLPVGVAIDEANAKLYILNKEGQPAGATISRGYVSIYDVSTPATPTFLEAPLFYKATGSLLDVEIDTAADIFFDEGLLWITNGTDEVGAINMTATPYKCSKYIEPTGAGYALRDPAQVFVQTTTGGFKHVFIGNGALGVIERFDQLTLKHQDSYGYRALEDELNSYNRLSNAVYGAVGFAQGVVADRVYLDGKETDVLICADTLNKRLHRFNLNAYEEDNFANFDMLTFEVPIEISGWTVSGDIPTDMVTVHYRFAETEDFRELNCNAAGLQPTSSLQLRVSVQLDSRRFVRDWFIRDLVLHGSQA